MRDFLRWLQMLIAFVILFGVWHWRGTIEIGSATVSVQPLYVTAGWILYFFLGWLMGRVK